MLKLVVPAWLRAAGCALLLTLLAVCGYMGARGPETAAVSVPIERTTLEAAQGISYAPQNTGERLDAERAQEIAMLDEVIESGKADAATVSSALAQKTEITRRMEAEAQAEAVLAGMGIEGVTAVCGAEMLTLVLPESEAQSDADRAKILDAASRQTGISTESVKIILVKSEAEDCAEGENLLY